MQQCLSLSPFLNCREAVVRFEAKEEEEEIHSAPALVKEAKPVAANNEVVKEAVPVVQEAKEEMVKEEVDMEEQDYIRHVTNTNMKRPGVENRTFNNIAFR